ncbi:hypothetical protein GGI04_005219 [Coemansia thaxteri]|nr:hypothetical protein GGI04_005219 [Coemansia thaxteri]KAJ2470041.1 hypothetical protein GGI02_003190 [Coemansia sp. RSA 2322]
MSSAGLARLTIGCQAAGLLAQITRQSLCTSLRLASTAAAAAKWSPSSVDLVNRLRDQQKYYATVVIKGRPFTVTQNDIIVMDRIKELELGDSLALNQVTELGSRDFTIKGQPFIDSSLFSVKATVIEHADGKLFTVTKKKRRTAHQKVTYHRNRHTMLRVSMIDVAKL